MLLNYNYRLQPTDAQAESLQRSMQLIRWGWNLAVRRERWAGAMIRLGRAAQLRRELAELVSHRKMTGQRVTKIGRLVAAEGLTGEQAEARLRADDIREVWLMRRAVLRVSYACAVVDAAKQSLLGKRLSGAWSKLTGLKGKFPVAWQAARAAAKKRRAGQRQEAYRQAPRKNKDSLSGWLCVQMQGRNPTTKRVNAYGDRYIELSMLMPGAADTEVRFLQHRPLPADAVMKELKVIRRRGVWQVVFTVESEQPREYPATGLSCGIDPGITTPCTLAGEDMPLGVGGREYGPGLTPKAAKQMRRDRRKLRRDLRKIDRQRRATNPHCYGFDGVWIKGARITVVSNGMRETQDRIAAAHAHWAAQRKNIWSEAANEILSRYDTVYFGNWKDSTPKKKGEARRRRREAFAKDGEKRPKGEARRQRTVNRRNRDNGLGGFRQVLAERAAASATPKQVILTREAGTTRCCARCGAAAGPAGQKGLRRRVWTCPECKFRQKRDCSAAWNILQLGKRQRAGGQPGMGGRNNPSVAGGSQVLPTPGKGSVPGIEQTIARGQVVSSSREALARAQPAVSQRDGDIPDRGPGPLRRARPTALAKGTVNPGKDST